MSAFEVSGLRAAPGEVVKGHLGHVTLGDGTQVGVPIVIVNGAEDGPTLTVTTSVHGTEVVGVGALLEVAKSIDPQQLKGRLIAITAANPFAFQEGTYDTPYDHINLSGPIFSEPNPGGRLTERIAAFIAPVVEMSSYWIDLHANPDPSIAFSLVNWNLCPDDQTREGTRLIADAFGVTVIESPGDPATSQRDLRYTHRVPTMTSELTGNMFLREDNVRVGVIGITNVLKAIGALDGDLEPQPNGRLEGDFVSAGRLLASAGGLLWVRKEPGVFYSEGTVVAEIVNVWGEVVQQIKMPVDGYCWAFGGRPGTTHVVAEGTPVNYIFRKRD